MYLYVSGGKHIHRDSTKRKEEITEALNGNPEVVFTEESAEPDNDKEKLRNLLAAPLILFSLLLWTLVLKILRIPFNSDQKLTNEITHTQDVEKIKVDRPITPLISEARILWLFSNWLIIAIVVFIYSSVGLSSAMFVLVLFVFILFLSFIAATAAPRNYAIAMNTMQAVKENEYKRGVLVVGSEHVEEVKRHISRASNQIELVEV